jgi:hypothetical protein
MAILYSAYWTHVGWEGKRILGTTTEGLIYYTYHGAQTPKKNSKVKMCLTRMNESCYVSCTLLLKAGGTAWTIGTAFPPLSWYGCFLLVVVRWGCDSPCAFYWHVTLFSKSKKKSKKEQCNL